MASKGQHWEWSEATHRRKSRLMGRLKRMARDQGLSNETLADCLDVSPRTIQRWMKGTLPHGHYEDRIEILLEAAKANGPARPKPERLPTQPKPIPTEVLKPESKTEKIFEQEAWTAGFKAGWIAALDR